MCSIRWLWLLAQRGRSSFNPDSAAEAQQLQFQNRAMAGHARQASVGLLAALPLAFAVSLPNVHHAVSLGFIAALCVQMAGEFYHSKLKHLPQAASISALVLRRWPRPPEQQHREGARHFRTWVCPLALFSLQARFEQGGSWRAGLLALVLAAAQSIGPVPILAVWAYRRECMQVFQSRRLSPPFVTACGTVYVLAALALPLTGDGGVTSARSFRAIATGHMCLAAALVFDFVVFGSISSQAAVIPMSAPGNSRRPAQHLAACWKPAARTTLVFAAAMYSLWNIWPMFIMFEGPPGTDAGAAFSALAANGTHLPAAGMNSTGPAADSHNASVGIPLVGGFVYTWAVALWAVLEIPVLAARCPSLHRDGTVALHCCALLALTPLELTAHSMLHVLLVVSRALGYLALPEKQVALHSASRQQPQMGTRIWSNTKRTAVALQLRIRRILSVTASAIGSIATHASTRGLFWFLLLNVACMVAEAAVGYASDSLALLSDAAHMASDCVSVCIGLAAAFYATVPHSDARRAAQGERLAGFVNGVLLLLSAVSIVATAIFRLQHPKEVHGQLVLPVAVLGLGVNIAGLFIFHDHSGHGHCHGHGHSHSHGHSCGGAHSAHEDNMHSVYLHIAADTLGSAGVLLSYALARSFGWSWADPVCSILVAALIIASVVPVLRRTGAQLCAKQAAPVQHKPHSMPAAVADDLACIPGITGTSATVDPSGVVTVVVQLANSVSDAHEVRAEVQRSLRLHGMLGCAVTTATPGHGSKSA